MDFLNGRVNAITNVNNYNLKNIIENTTENNTNIISRNINCTDVSSMFFSDKNVDLLQFGIRNKILNMTDGKYNIGKQSDIDLKIVMRSMYYQYGKNADNFINKQVLDLNTRVIEWCVQEIISNIKQSEQYKIDISTLPIPLDRSILPSQKGLRTLEIMKSS
jgi:Family of unknown function (DUF5761)